MWRCLQLPLTDSKDKLSPHYRHLSRVSPQGYSFCEFVDDTVTDQVIKTLGQKKLGSKMLTVKRALEGHKPEGHPPMSPTLHTPATSPLLAGVGVGSQGMLGGQNRSAMFMGIPTGMQGGGAFPGAMLTGIYTPPSE